MQELIDFLQKEFPNGCSIMTPQFERTEKLEFEYKPTDVAEFTAIVEKAPWNILKGFGFGKWDTMSNLVKENNSKVGKGMISIPSINGPDLFVDLEPKENALLMEPETDEWVLLFPHEWYNIIPDGFMVTGLSGEQYPFEASKTDDDMRFGCLAYGIKRCVHA